MRKLILLGVFVVLGLGAKAQIDTVLFENFENGIPSTWIQSGRWNDTNLVSVSPTMSLHNYGGGSPGYSDTLVLPSFSTIDTPYVSLNYYQIAKVFFQNGVSIEYSINNGAWQPLRDSNYTGTAIFSAPSNVTEFNDFFYASATQGNPWQIGVDATPTNTWWRQESYNLTSVFGNNLAGYSNCRLRLVARRTFSTATPPTINYYAGWFIDNFLITRAPCELEPPEVSLDYTPSPCFANKPEGAVVEEFSGNYPIGALASDIGTGIDKVVLYYRQKGASTFTVDTMSASGIIVSGQAEFTDSIDNVSVGDTIQWFVRAFDNACPNITRSPDSLVQLYYEFSPITGLPQKCGSPDCGSQPTTISTFPWTENFENTGFVAGTATSFRGSFPDGPTLGNYWTVVAPTNDLVYAWSVINQATYTRSTGPNEGHSTLGDKYLYAEASAPNSSSVNTNNNTTFTNLVTPCIDLTNVNQCISFEFWYHMFGTDIGALMIDIDTGVFAAGFKTVLTITGQQQDSSNADWKRGVVDLTPYLGSFIRIRAKAEKSITAGEIGDIAIDDFRIFYPAAQEFELLSIESPKKGGCSYSSTEPLTVIVRSAACDTANFIPLAYQVNGGTIVRDTVFGSFSLGDQVQFTFSDSLDFSAFNTYDVQVWTDEPADADKSNDTLNSETIDYGLAYSNFPLIENFENYTVGSNNFSTSGGFFKLVDGVDEEFNWQIGVGLTSIDNTGPWRGYYFDEDSKYLVAEPVKTGTGVSTGTANTYFQSNYCFDFSTLTNPMLTFAYHLYGANIDKLMIEYSEGIGGEVWIPLSANTITANSGTNQFTGEVNDWKIAKVNLVQFAGKSIKLRIVGVRKNVGLLTNMAIDNVQIYERPTVDVGVSRIQRPNIGIAVSGLVDPIITIENYSDTDVNNFPVSLRITPLCGPNAGVSTVHTQTVSTVIVAESNIDYTFTIATATPPIVFPVGEFKLDAFTANPNDTYTQNDTTTKNVIKIGEFDISGANDGFSDDFDDCGFSKTGFAPTGSGFRQWELGPLATTVISSPFSSPNVWSTNIDGNAVSETSEELFLPNFIGFQTDSIAAAEVRFYQQSDFKTNAAGTIEYSVAGGWKPVVGDDPTRGTNWFGSSLGTIQSGILSTAYTNGTPPGAWETSMDGNGWVFTSYPISFYNFSSIPLVMRFRYQSNAGTNDGWAIDNFSIYIPPQHSASPVDVKPLNPLPIPGNPQRFGITVQNTGERVLRSYVQEIIWDFGEATQKALGPDTIIASRLLLNGYRNYTEYAYGILASQASSGIHKIAVVTSYPNSNDDDLMVDDTLFAEIRILDLLEFNSVNNNEYCNDFDGNLGNSEFFALNNYTYDNDPDRFSWEKGAPVQTTPFSGTDVWMTDLDDNYKSRDSSALFTPAFTVEKDTNYEVSFMHWFNTELATDGGTFMVSDNSGLTWQTIGYSSENNWYNTRFINALDIIKPGWSDTSSGWDSASYVFKFQQGDAVVFKFRFESDWDLQYPGWAIDNFCIRTTNKTTGYVIGQEEYNPIGSVFFGDLAPNPSKGQSTLPFTIADNVEMHITVTNLMGQTIQIRDERFEKGSNAIFFETNKWSSGMYNINVSFEGTTINRKLIVQH